MEQEKIRSKILSYAYRVLARREHSSSELLAKLEKKFPELTEYFTGIIAHLKDNDIVNDARFTEMMIRMYQRQGKGPFVIQRKLQEKGISNVLIQKYLSSSKQFLKILQEVYEKKRAREKPGQDPQKMKARMVRFLIGKGFDSGAVWKVVGASEYDLS